MKNVMIAATAATLCTGAAQAGGFERSTTPLGFLFEKGNYVELSFGHVTPKVSGALIAAPSVTTGNVTKSYSTVGLAIKTDINDKLSLGVTIDPTFGADVEYPTGTGFPLAGSTGTLRGETVAALARYKINDSLSVHGGIRSVGIGGDLFLPAAGNYRASFGNDRDIGYLIGAAYEKPEIALRVALTYASGTSHNLNTTIVGVPVAFDVPFKLPKSWTLDFQSGVAKDTLVFGSIRWMDWTETRLDGPLLPDTVNPLISYDHDSITYNIGIGRRFSETFSGAVSLGYEKSTTAALSAILARRTDRKAFRSAAPTRATS